MCIIDTIESSTVGGAGDGGRPNGDKPALLDYIYRSQIGSGASVRTAFGERLVTFADYTVSGSYGYGMLRESKCEVASDWRLLTATVCRHRGGR